MPDKQYFGCRIVQRIAADTPALFVFYARAKDIVTWAGARRSADQPEGTQRILRPTRRRAIQQFLRSNGINIIPNNILLAFNRDVARFESLDNELNQCLQLELNNGCGDQMRWGSLHFRYEEGQPEHLRPALVVDGQHRLFGISDFEEEDLPLLVVCLLDASLYEQAFQFIVINNKAVRVPTDNVKSIIADLRDEVSLEQRLLRAGVRYSNKTPLLAEVNDLPTSPFQKLLAWDYNREGRRIVPITAIEQATRYVKETFQRYLEDDEDSLIEIFSAMWRPVQFNYPEIWGAEGNLMTKVVITALTEFLADRLKLAYEMGFIDIFELQKVEEQVLAVIRQIPQEFWATRWTPAPQDNANYRNLIKGDLETLLENSKLRRPWQEKLELIGT